MTKQPVTKQLVSGFVSRPLRGRDVPKANPKKKHHEVLKIIQDEGGELIAQTTVKNKVVYSWLTKDKEPRNTVGIG